MKKNKPLISIVVTTKNETRNIGKCLRSIRNQNIDSGKVEIIVVDNKSKDNTRQIARKFTNLVYNRGPERSAQRNYGAKKSKGMYFMYLDADMSLAPGLLKEAIGRFKKDLSLVALYIPEIVTGNSFWTNARRFERSFYNATPIDCVRIVRKKVFQDVGGFDESMTGPEDWDFDKKIRKAGKVGIIMSPIYHDESEFSLFYYLKKKNYYGKSFRTYIKRWGGDDPDIKKQFGILYRFLIVFIENGKWKKLINHPILTCKMFFLRFLVGIQYVLSR